MFTEAMLLIDGVLERAVGEAEVVDGRVEVYVIVKGVKVLP